MKARLLGAICFFIFAPTAAQAQVFKCVGEHGRMIYSDRPCSNEALQKVEPTDRTSVHAEASQKPKLSFLAPAGLPTLQPQMQPTRPPAASRRTAQPPVSSSHLSERDKEMIREGSERFDKGMRDLTQRCKDGDQAVCAELACMSLDGRKGPASDFIACAKNRGYVHGTFWTLLGQKPLGSPENDPHLVAAALTPQLPEGKHTSALHTLRMICFRQAATGKDVQGIDRSVDQNLYVSKGPRGAEMRRTYSKNIGTTDRIAEKSVVPEFTTIAEAADKICEK